jgi:NAD(P)-dependent dehydrogenase (short-subunit alcohol dehydrogenase family)
MTDLVSFEDGAKVAIVGASGGIGSAFLRRVANAERVAAVYAFSRREIDAPNDKVRWQALDLEDESTIERAADSIGDDDLDLVLVLSGILHQGDEVQPERRLAELGAGNLDKLFRINAVGPALVAKHFLGKLRRRKKTVFAVLSARVGSISDNRLGGWASYRTSKAALNQLMRTIAIEQSRRHPNSIVVTLHPGTVDTALSRPFTSSTPEDKLFSPDQATDYLLRVIDELKPEDSGGLFAWDGARIEY